ncbi:unnamed protein product [Lepidochelys kempii]
MGYLRFGIQWGQILPWCNHVQLSEISKLIFELGPINLVMVGSTWPVSIIRWQATRLFVYICTATHCSQGCQSPFPSTPKLLSTSLKSSSLHEYIYLWPDSKPSVEVNRNLPIDFKELQIRRGGSTGNTFHPRIFQGSFGLIVDLGMVQRLFYSHWLMISLW